MASGLHFILLFFVLVQGQTEIGFLPGSSMLSTDRDGILLVSLKAGVNATVCANGFTNIFANRACRAMGYPAKGISVLAKKRRLVKNMKMVVIKCKGSEDSLKECEIITDGRLLRHCMAKHRTAHVVCLEKKVKHISRKLSARTNCNVNNGRVRLARIPGKMNTGFLQIRETTSSNYRFVCNKRMNFGRQQAKLFCGLICRDPSNPRPIMYMNPGTIAVSNGYFKDMLCPNGATNLDQCSNINEFTPCDPVFNVALRCGNEIKKPEPAPNVICSNRSMIIEWAMQQTFHLDSKLVDLHRNHTAGCISTKTDKDNKVIIKIPLDYCNPIITDHEKTIKFKYTIVRSYPNTGRVQFKTKELIDVFCDIPKIAEISKEYVHKDITYPPVIGTTFLGVMLTLHTDSDFEDLLPKPYDIEFYTPIYAKATISNPLDQIKLTLSNCFVTSAKTFIEINPQNSAKIIDESCPVETYDVQLVPISKWSIGFQFTAFKLVESNKDSVNIFCETIKCMLLDDPDCGVCKVRSNRKKRSATLIKSSIIKAGPITLH